MKQNAEGRSKFGSEINRLGFKINQFDLTYQENFLYQGSVYLGESSKEATVIFDTGSDWLIVNGKGCKSCYGSLYDPSTSDYFVPPDPLKRKTKKRYGTFVTVEGVTVADQVCLSPRNACVDPLQFFFVLDQVGMPLGTDGIMGLAMGNTPSGKFNMPQDFIIGISLLKELR